MLDVTLGGSIRYVPLASGSKGNCHAICDGDRVLLIDAGVSLSQIKKRLGSIGWRSDRVRGVAITHEHGDHIGAVPAILKKTDWTILATPGTLDAIRMLKGMEVPKSRWVPLETGRAQDWEGWRLHPFALPHDATDPVGYRIEAGGARLAVVTDLGHATDLAIEYAKDVELLVLESNHDVGMLRDGPYPPQIKVRILSRLGHLSNDSCAGMLEKVLSPALRHIVLAHLSEQNNDPALARLAAADVIEKSGCGASLQVACPDGAFEGVSFAVMTRRGDDRCGSRVLWSPDEEALGLSEKDNWALINARTEDWDYPGVGAPEPPAAQAILDKYRPNAGSHAN